jgi:hypothetical protein
VTVQTGQPWNVLDTGNDISLTDEGADRWNFFGNPADFNPSHFGCACAMPDVADANPVIGTGGPRNIQLGIKAVF